eukprot:scaffold263924_cov31-Tisochrysis_lutea.AAC.4
MEGRYGQVIDVELRIRLAKRDLIVRDAELGELAQRDGAHVCDDCRCIALMRAHPTAGGDNDVVPLCLERTACSHVLRDRLARRVVTRHARRRDESVVEVEADA